ncbi:hypothetical protein KGF56_001546 [Candida oxycetoniae]|uniref:SUN domain-containing protein n=1 Tax=Candida oxycetoniae TaxID=497107 RepID=A0AAI9WYV3_9ASCO|nr:uncharacterized protein KGF56_001546 [Candida oxycetoniae]KAI3405528.2 hypothetical protein KGF56_001546 [Candida oxycetoniae]
MVPRYSGSTDDENSIHLKNMIGKARPLRSPPKYSYTNMGNGSTRAQQSVLDKDAAHINSTDKLYHKDKVDKEISLTIDGDNANLDERELNESYIKFLNHIDDDSYFEKDGDSDFTTDEEEDTYNEEYSDDDDDDEYISEKRSFNGKGLFNKAAETQDFIEKPALSNTSTNTSQSSIDSKSREPSIRTSKNNKRRNGSLSLLFVALASFLLTVACALVLNFAKSWLAPSMSMSMPITNYDEAINSEYLNRKICQLEELIRETHLDSQDKFNKLHLEINQLEIPQDNQDNLIKLNNGQVQIAPEFHQFLNKFLEAYQNSYIDQKLKSYESLEDLNKLKQHVNEAVAESVNTIEKKVKTKVDRLLGNLTIVDDTLYPSTSNKLWMNSMLELISKSSRYKNYADFNNGARILGFLTSSPKNEKGLFKKVFSISDWFANDVLSPYDANHVILDDGVTWRGGDEVGIRLNPSIIPTDILIQCDEHTRTQNIEVSIAIKPDTKAGFDRLKFDIIHSSNKYTSKYKVLKTNKLKPGINHIKLPIRFINSQISGRNLYFKFNGPVNISSIKVYGITELDAVQFRGQLELLVDKFTEDDTVPPSRNQERNKEKEADERVYDINEDIYL